MSHSPRHTVARHDQLQQHRGSETRSHKSVQWESDHVLLILCPFLEDLQGEASMQHARCSEHYHRPRVINVGPIKWLMEGGMKGGTGGAVQMTDG